MKPGSPWLSWLAVAAATDWLLGRTLARSAIFMPKSPTVLAAYQFITISGQVAAVLTALLAILGVLWLAWNYRGQARWVLTFSLAGLAGLSLLFMVAAPPAWLRLAYQVLLLGAVGALGWLAWTRVELKIVRLALLLPCLALWSGGIYSAIQALYTAAHWPGPALSATVVFNIGELFAVLTPLGFWWVYGRRSAGRIVYLLALLPAVGFAGFYLAAPSIAGVLAIWSTGLTLYLPWPLYAAALWLGCATLLASRRTAAPPGIALLLLAAGGYAPILSSQAFLGLLSLSICCAPGINPDAPNCQPQAYPISSDKGGPQSAFGF